MDSKYQVCECLHCHKKNVYIIDSRVMSVVCYSCAKNHIVVWNNEKPSENDELRIKIFKLEQKQYRMEERINRLESDEDDDDFDDDEY